MEELMSNFEKQQDALQKKMASMEGKGGKIMDKVAKREKTSEEMKVKIEMMHKLFNEAIELYKTGELKYKQMVDDLYKSMMALED